MINSAKSARLLANYGELLSKNSFDLSSLKKGLFLDRVFFLSRLYLSLLCSMPSKVLNMALDG
jgi:hypothetical protein